MKNKIALFNITVICIIFVITITCFPALTKGKESQRSKIGLLSEISGFLGSLGDAIDRFTEGLKKGSKNLIQTYDLISVRLEISTLRKMHRDMKKLYGIIIIQGRCNSCLLGETH